LPQVKIEIEKSIAIAEAKLAKFSYYHQKTHKFFGDNKKDSMKKKNTT